MDRVEAQAKGMQYPLGDRGATQVQAATNDDLYSH